MLPSRLDRRGQGETEPLRNMPVGRLFCILTALFLVLSGPRAVEGAELVMFESEACSWCERWDAEIAPIYPKTAEARIAPLRRVDVDDALPADLKTLKAVVYTPTFVLMHQQKEIGRILGYPGEDFFWALLEELMAKLTLARNKERTASQDPATASVICEDTAATTTKQDLRMSC